MSASRHTPHHRKKNENSVGGKMSPFFSVQTPNILPGADDKVGVLIRNKVDEDVIVKMEDYKDSNKSNMKVVDPVDISAEQNVSPMKSSLKSRGATNKHISSSLTSSTSDPLSMEDPNPFQSLVNSLKHPSKNSNKQVKLQIMEENQKQNSPEEDNNDEIKEPLEHEGNAEHKKVKKVDEGGGVNEGGSMDVSSSVQKTGPPQYSFSPIIHHSVLGVDDKLIPRPIQPRMHRNPYQYKKYYPQNMYPNEIPYIYLNHINRRSNAEYVPQYYFGMVPDQQQPNHSHSFSCKETPSASPSISNSAPPGITPYDIHYPPPSLQPKSFNKLFLEPKNHSFVSSDVDSVKKVKGLDDENPPSSYTPNLNSPSKLESHDDNKFVDTSNNNDDNSNKKNNNNNNNNNEVHQKTKLNSLTLEITSDDEESSDGDNNNNSNNNKINPNYRYEGTTPYHFPYNFYTIYPPPFTPQTPDIRKPPSNTPQFWHHYPPHAYNFTPVLTTYGLEKREKNIRQEDYVKRRESKKSCSSSNSDGESMDDNEKSDMFCTPAEEGEIIKTGYNKYDFCLVLFMYL
jgi:hypothetical protein